MKVKSEFLVFSCSHCRKSYEEKFYKGSIKHFANIYGFCNGNINKFYLMKKSISLRIYEYLRKV